MRFLREGPLVVLEACLIGIVGKAALAMLLTRLAEIQFDAAIGRPRRSARPTEIVMEGRGRLLVPSAPVTCDLLPRLKGPEHGGFAVLGKCSQVRRAECR